MSKIETDLFKMVLRALCLIILKLRGGPVDLEDLYRELVEARVRLWEARVRL
jgi:hypothetical protein